MKKIISSVLACLALFSVAATASASATTSHYNPEAANNKGIEYTVNASLFKTTTMIDIIVPAKMDAQIIRAYMVPTDEEFKISGDEETQIGDINATYLMMCFFSPEYQIVNNGDIPIKVFANVSATPKGKINLFDEKKLGVDVESDNKKNLRLWLSHSMTEGGTTPAKVNGQNAFEPDIKGDILITKKAAKTPYVLFDRLGTKGNNNIGYFRINGQAKEIPNPYYDAKDGVNIKLVLKITPANSDEE